MKISLIQTNPGIDRPANLLTTRFLMEQAIAADSPDLLVLPEYFEYYGGTPADKVAAAQTAPGGAAYEMAKEVARGHQVYVHAGSLLEKIPGDERRIYNTTVVFDRHGDEIARYRKIHLFDIVSPDGTVYKESATVAPGDDIVTYDVDGMRIGCAICYDIRFPELFSQLARQRVDIIILPAAFTLQTGKDHWEVLARARAIETQTYFVACGQCGTHYVNGQPRQTYGHSLVCDPWGHVIAKASDGEGFVTARLETSTIRQARELIPLHAHHRLIDFPQEVL